jgi:hypothetical protein
VIAMSTRVNAHKVNAIKHLELMQDALDARDYKKAIYHQQAANIAIDSMVEASEMVK